MMNIIKKECTIKLDQKELTVIFFYNLIKQKNKKNNITTDLTKTSQIQTIKIIFYKSKVSLIMNKKNIFKIFFY